jgi:hypothetical protein
VTTADMVMAIFIVLLIALAVSTAALAVYAWMH